MDGLQSNIRSANLRLMEIAGKRILIEAEVDSIDENGQWCLIKSGKYNGNKTMFQMISSGAQILIKGYKNEKNIKELKNIRVSSITDIIHSFGVKIAEFKKNLEKSLQEIERAKADIDEGITYKLVFTNQEYQFVKSKTSLFPPNDKVSELLSSV